MTFSPSILFLTSCRRFSLSNSTFSLAEIVLVLAVLHPDGSICGWLEVKKLPLLWPLGPLSLDLIFFLARSLLTASFFFFLHFCLTFPLLLFGARPSRTSFCGLSRTAFGKIDGMARWWTWQGSHFDLMCSDFCVWGNAFQFVREKEQRCSFLFWEFIFQNIS